jgi:hypothetical protein
VTRTWLALIVAALGVLLTGCTGAGQRNDGDREGVTWIRRPYKVHVGDDASWAAPDLDDSEWPSVDSRLMRGATVPGWEGLGWFRVWIESSPELSGHPVPMHGRFVGAAAQGASATTDGVAPAPSTPPSDDEGEVPVSIGVVYPLATNANRPNVGSNADLSVIYGRVGRVEGAQLGGVVGHASRGVEGVQIGGVGTIADGSVSGAQLCRSNGDGFCM